jgi:hypothetical protein
VGVLAAAAAAPPPAAPSPAAAAAAAALAKLAREGLLPTLKNLLDDRAASVRQARHSPYHCCCSALSLPTRAGRVASRTLYRLWS